MKSQTGGFLLPSRPAHQGLGESEVNRRILLIDLTACLVYKGTRHRGVDEDDPDLSDSSRGRTVTPEQAARPRGIAQFEMNAGGECNAGREDIDHSIRLVASQCERSR